MSFAFVVLMLHSLVIPSRNLESSPAFLIFSGLKFMGHRPEKNHLMLIAKQMTGRDALFLLYLGLSILTFYAPLKLLMKSSLENELYSHILLIPFVSAYLAYTERGRIRESAASALPGSILILAGIACYFVGREFGPGLETNDFLSVMTFAAVLCWIGGFVAPRSTT